MNRLITVLCWLVILFFAKVGLGEQPNILFCISDDQSFAHTGANGDPVIRTPVFDRIAREGILFANAYCDAPTCGPSRSAILTGQHIWRLEEAGNLHSTLPAKFATYTGELQKAGYAVGYTGKGWSPGRLQPGGRKENPAGKPFAKRRLKPDYKSMAHLDYASNFEDFLDQKAEDKPFCFWLGTFEPHRAFESGAGKRAGLDPSKVKVPAIFPDNDIVRNDILDYMVECEHFDKMVGRAIKLLEKRGELDNTIVVVTSDHGMPFPRAKASLYDWGTHVPLAIRWPGGIKDSGRKSYEFVNLSDLAATFLDAANVKIPKMMTSRSLKRIFAHQETGDDFQFAFIAMERHDGCRKGGKGYPCRAVRTKNYLYIYNFEHTRWPAGSPDKDVCARRLPFGEVDSSPTKTFMMDNANKHGHARLHHLAFGIRPAEELYFMPKDPHKMKNLAFKSSDSKTELRSILFEYLKDTKDPRAIKGMPALWDHYPYYGFIHPDTKNWRVDPPEK